MRKPLVAMVLGVLAFGLVAGKKPKNEEPAPAPEAAAPAPAAAEEPEAAPAPEPEPTSSAPNANFDATITRADGSKTSGHVVRVERSSDWYGEEGWTDSASKLTITVEGNGTEKDVPWDQVRSVEVSYLGKANIDCDYDSTYTPLMWTCAMKTTSKVTLADGGGWTVANRHKWRLTFSDGKVEEFWLNRVNARQQEEAPADMNNPDRNDVVNADLQIALQASTVEQAAKGVTRIDVKAP